MHHYLPNTPWILIGTKTDLREDEETIARLQRQDQRGPIEYEEGKHLADTYGAFAYLEVSSLANEGLRAILDTMAEVAFEAKGDKKKARNADTKRNTLCSLM